MLLNVLIILQLCVSLNHARMPMNFESQTIVRLTLESPEPISPCKCQNGKCSVDDAVTDNICLTIHKQFEYSGSSNPNFLFCQVDPDTCSKQRSPNPKQLFFHLIFDQYYLSTSGIYMGQNGLVHSMKALFNGTNWPAHLASKLRLVQAKADMGKNAMPIEFTGVLNMPVDKAEEYYYCHQAECREFVVKFCGEFIKALRDGKHPFTKFLIGYHVKRIYVADSETRIDWAVLFQYRHLMEQLKIKSRQQLFDSTHQILEKVKLPAMLKSIKVNRALPLDFCEIDIEGFTTSRYHSDFLNPLARRTRVLTEQYYNELIKQIATGDDQCPTCFRSTHGIYLENAGHFVRTSMHMWVSGSCYRKRGLKTCEDITKAVSDQWLRGKKIVHNPIAPWYNFKLRYSGYLMDK